VLRLSPVLSRVCRGSETETKMKWLGAILGVFTRLWDWWFDPKRRQRRDDAVVDKTIAEHDEKKANEILDAGRPR